MLWFTDCNPLLLLHRPPLTYLITTMLLKALWIQPLPLRRLSSNSGNSHFSALGILFSPGQWMISVGHRVEVSSSRPRSCSIALRRPQNSCSITTLLFFGYPNQTYQHVPCDGDVKDVPLIVTLLSICLGSDLKRGNTTIVTYVVVAVQAADGQADIVASC